MKNRLCSILLALFAVFLTAIPANAQLRTPYKNAQWPFIKVTADSNGPSALLGVHNTDDDPVGVTLLIKNQDPGHVVLAQEFILGPKQTRTWNFRDLNLPLTPTEEYPDGVFYGYFEINAERRVLISDNFAMDPGNRFADGNQTIPKTGRCVDHCDHFVVRHLQGGNFDGGTCLQVLHTAPFFENPTIDIVQYDEPGSFVGGFSIGDAPASSEICLRDYEEQIGSNFGTTYLDLPGDNGGLVTVTYSAYNNYTVGLEAWCIPPCDECDPQGPCYEPHAGCGPQCIPATLELVSGSQTACQIGVPFSATLRASGTDVGDIVCDPLPAGLARNGNTISGTCVNLDTPFIHCEVGNPCGEDSISIPVTPEEPEYGIEVEKRIQHKGCVGAGQTTADVIFNIVVRNVGSVSQTVDISDPSVPACDIQNVSIDAGATYTRTCNNAYPIGDHENIATVTVDGTPISVSSPVEINILECPQACDGVPQPSFNFSILNQNNTTATTRSVLSYSGDGVSGAVNFSPPPSGGFTGGIVTSGTNNDSVFQKTATDYTATANWQVSRDSEVCYSGSETVIIEQQAGCEDYPVPTITFGTPFFNDTPTTRQVVTIPASPSGGTWNPSLPSEHFPRPAWNEPAESETFLYSLPYSPVAGLSCTATKSITVTIPPKDPTCADFPVDVIEGTPVTSQTATQFTISSIPYTTNPNTAGTMAWTPSLPHTVNRPAAGQPAGSVTFNGVFTYTPATGLTCTATASKTVSIPPQTQTCADFPVTVTSGTPVTSQTATQHTTTSIPYTTSPNTTGTMVWTPSLPHTVNRPLFGQPNGSVTFNGVFTYTPASGLTCTANASKTVSIPAQACETSNPPTGDLTWNSSGNPLTGNATVANAGTFHLYIYATSAESECNAQTYDNEKVHQQVTKACGQTGTLSGSYNWASHGDEWWRVVLKVGTTLIEQSGCIRNNQNLTEFDDEELLRLDPQNN